MRSLLFCYLFLATAFLPGSLYAQDFHYPVVIQKIMFSGAGYINIRHDSLATVYSGWHWLSASERRPVAYVSGSTLSLQADFSFSCSQLPDSVRVRAVANDSIYFAAQSATVTASGGKGLFSYAGSAAHLFQPGVADYMPDYRIRWEWSLDKGSSWSPIDTTHHTVYVTRSAPMPETSTFRYFHTVLHLSCSNAAGASTDTGIIRLCWQEFLDHVVLNYKGDSLHYYKTLNSPYTTLPSLLKYRDAECYTFAQLFLSLLKIQGVVRSNNYVFIEPDYRSYSCGTVSRFLVKNWQFHTKSDSSACPDFPYTNSYSGSFATGSAYTWISADVTDLTGAPGQCNANPASYFNNHQIVKLDGKYYDACYGLTFDKLSDIKKIAFDGWGMYQFTGSGLYKANFSPDLGKAELQESISTW
jgi:hypothetical protein